MPYPRCSSARATVLVRCGLGAVGVLMMASCVTARETPPLRTSPDPSAPVVSPSPSREDTARQAAIAVYSGMWQAMARAGANSDWRSSEPARYATGDALTAITKSLYADHANGVVTRGAPVLSPLVRSVEPPLDPTSVLIDDCGDSTQWLKYFEGTDNPAGDSNGGGRRSITAEVLRQPDGSWRVARFAVEGPGSC